MDFARGIDDRRSEHHTCVRCGHTSGHRWLRCPRCLAFANKERPRDPEREELLGLGGGLDGDRDGGQVDAPSPSPLAEIAAEAMPRSSTGLRELDRVLGQGEDGAIGLAPGQALVLGGEPGIGKSTLLLQALSGLSRDGGARVLYASGEESREQVAARARRLAIEIERVDVLETRRLEDVERALESGTYGAVVIDSMQAISAADVDSDAGSVRQVKLVADRLTALAKSSDLILWLVGQATKDGRIAGPLAAEHAVDTVLWFETDTSGGYRVLRAIKNRFGPAGELAVFEMRASGLAEVLDPSALFAGARRDRARPPGSAWALVAENARPLVIEVQALVTGERKGDAPARRVASGIEAGRLALLLAVLEQRAELALRGDVYVDVDSGVRPSERALDLPIALALGSAVRGAALPKGLTACGELALTGEVRAVPRIEARLHEAKRLGFTHAFVPAEQERSIDTRALEGLSIEPIATISAALEACA
jgi:DNA repair protein RadA/Sms